MEAAVTTMTYVVSDGPLEIHIKEVSSSNYGDYYEMSQAVQGRPLEAPIIVTDILLRQLLSFLNFMQQRNDRSK
jgi:hypothetical protein